MTRLIRIGKAGAPEDNALDTNSQSPLDACSATAVSAVGAGETRKGSDISNKSNPEDYYPGPPAGEQNEVSRNEVLDKGFTETLELSASANNGDTPGRHLLVFLDGTWNEERTPIGEATPTNVLRMFQELNKRDMHRDKSPIKARYYRGVGCRQDNSTQGHMWYGFNGKDEERIRKAAYAGLFRDYVSPNDLIYIIGFSRGAASARLLARDLCKDGFPGRLKIHTCYFSNLLTGQIEARVENIERIGDVVLKPKVGFLGCWDTVAAFDRPWKYPTQSMGNKIARYFQAVFARFRKKGQFDDEDREVPTEIGKAVHCVAIDETRHAFLPELMPSACNVEEVWFPGVHSDVGGGYTDNMLADEAYEFMKKRLKSFSLKAKDKNMRGGICFNSLYSATRPKSEENAIHDEHESKSYCFHFHGLNTGVKKLKDYVGFGSSMRKIRVSTKTASKTKPKIHSSFHKVKASSNVYAANKKDKRTWRVNYDPYNVRELEKYCKSPSEPPFESVA